MTLFTFFRWIVLLLLVVLRGVPSSAPPAALANVSSPRIGTVAGDFQVNSNGGANYIIPLTVPPGTNGSQPQLTLTYDSQAADGLVGMGFALTGLSSISRCPANAPLDGYNGGIYFDARDRFCLDGQRLILVSGSLYGAPGTIYHTEAETWTQVVAQGSCGSGPCSFSVRNKDGWQLDFGSTPTSRTALPGKAEIANWQIAQVTDLNRNTVAVTYQSDPANLQNHPAEIRYTGNAATGLQPVRRLVFDYQPRPDTVPRFVGGFRFSDLTRLWRIRTEVSGQPVLEYRLAYEQAPGTGRSRVRSITQCASSNDCLPATSFSWQNQVNIIASPNSDPQGLLRKNWCQGDGTEVGALDFDGDGRPDLHCDTADGNHFVLLSTSTGLKSPNANPDGLVKSGWCKGNTAGVVWIDFNGDGRGDLACNSQDGSYRVLVSTGDGVKSPNTNPDGLVKSGWCTAAAGCLAQWGNFNGDGRADLLGSASDGTQRVLVSTGTLLASPNSSPDGLVRTTWCTEANARTYWIDFNGDGLGDFVCSTPSGTHRVMVSTGTGVLSPNADPTGVVRAGWCTSNSRRQVTDFNGDGLDDIACSTASGTQSLLLSNGAVLTTPNENPDGQLRTGWCADKSPSWTDWNADGLADIACSAGNGDQSVLLSTGTGLRSPNSNPGGLTKSNWCSGDTARTVWLDFNGDALGDVVCHQKNGDQLALIHETTFPDVLSTVTNGLGGTMRVQYKPLTDSTVYIPGPPVAYPVLDVRTSLQVVSTYSTLDGRGGVSTYEQRYSGARTHLGLRRWLGFHSVSVTEPVIGRTLVDTFIQDYPVVGFVAESRVQDAAGTLLASSRFTPEVLKPFPKVFQVLPASATKSTYTDGTPDFTDRKLFRYDEHGDLILFSDLGDESQGTLPVYSCAKYTGPPNNWGFGYLLADKTTRDEQGCIDFLAASEPVWNPVTDLRWNQYGYDAAMNTITARNWDDFNSVFLVTRRVYNSYGLLTALTDPANRTTDYEYESTYQTLSLQLSPTNPAGERLRTDFVYEPRFGVLTRNTDPNDNSIEQRIDPFGRIVEVWGPDPASTSGAAAVLLSTESFQRDGVGAFSETRERPEWDAADPGNWFYSRTYTDGLGRPFRSVERGDETGKDVITESDYDSAGRVSRQSFPRLAGTNPQWVVTRYDLLNRPLTIAQPDGTTTRYDYIRGERLFTVTEATGAPEQSATTYEIDGRGNTVKLEQANGGISRARYDALAQQIEHTSAIGNVTTMAYDSLGRMRTSSNPDTGSMGWTYGPDGDLASNRDGAGNLVSYSYDALGRTTRQLVTRPDGATELTTFNYDNPAFANSKGKLTHAETPNAIQEYAYTRYGQVGVERLTLDGVSYTVGQTFDPAMRLLTSTLPDGSVIRRSYNTGGEMQSLDFQEGGQGAFINYATWVGYTALGQPLRTRFGNGLETTFTYYPVAERLGLPRTSTLTAGSVVRAAATYKWNRHGHVASVDLQIGTAPARREVFTHDAMSWLIQAQGAYGNLEYKYDLSGNLTKKDGITYTYPTGSNRMTAGSNGVELGYDSAGNLRTRTQPGTGLAYEYDGLGRMVAVQQDGNVISRSSYDIDSNRLRRTDADGGISRYISEDFDTFESGGTVYLTRYLRGPAGPVAAVTKAASSAAAEEILRLNALRLEPDLYSRATIAGLAGLAGSTNRRLAAWLVDVATPTMLTLGIGLTLALLIWLPRRRQGRELPFTYRSQHPFWAALVPLLIATLLLPTLPMPAEADLSPGTGNPAPGTLYFHGDQLSSTILVTNPEGEPVTAVASLPYGAIDQPRSSGPDNFRPKFTTKELDHDSGLYYFGSRFYDPVLGRFLTPDPKQQLDSPYVYAVNDPESYFDTEGEFAQLIAAIIIGAVIGAVTGAYFGGAAVNHDYNPGNWDWQAGKTWGGIFAGAAIGAAGGAIGGPITEAGVAPAIVGSAILGAGENAAFTALGGGSGKDILESALLGASVGAAISVGGAALIAGASRLGSSFARRGHAQSDLAENEGGLAALSDQATCSSFPAGTLVAIEGGLAPIENVTPGNRVLARRDSASEQPAAYPVMGCRQRDAAPLVTVEVGGEAIRATPQHLFWVVEKGWTEAGRLGPGDRLVTAEGTELPVARVVPTETAETVYNFEVASASTYFVSKLRILVHNPPCRLAKLPPTKSMTTKRQKESWKTKIDDLVNMFGNLMVWYEDPPTGRRLLDLQNYAFVEGGQTAVVSLQHFGKGSTRAQHFAYANKTYGALLKRRFNQSLRIQGQYSKSMEGTWHHHPLHKSVAFVPRILHRFLGHQGGISRLFR